MFGSRGRDRWRVVGAVVVPGKHVRALLVPLKALWPLVCPSSAQTPALPRPWPGWAAVSVGNSRPPGQPSGPTLQLSNSQAATRLPLLLRISSSTTSQACAWLHCFGLRPHALTAR